ncbi:MAG: tRNA-dihydrouridine synthase family protein [Bacteroidales bacterium]|nr:tRNA-dihydrouridine synthase family protein [Bacteroidales bacterium]
MAPLQGYTDAVFRFAHEKFFGGVDKYFTPFFRVENSEIRRREIRDLEFAKKLGDDFSNLIPQIIVSEKSELDILVKFLSDFGFKNIDLNFGCPYPVLNRKFKGAGILPYPEKFSEIVNSLTKYSDVKFSIKMRLGLSSSKECLKLIEIINQFPFDFVTIHPRTAQQQYSGEVDENAFFEFASQLKTRVIFNGNLTNLNEIESCIQKFPFVYALMIGRGILADPFLAKKYKSVENFEENQKEVLLKFHNCLIDNYLRFSEGGDKQVLEKMKTLWDYFLPNSDHKTCKNISKSRTLQEYIGFVNILINKL